MKKDRPLSIRMIAKMVDIKLVLKNLSQEQKYDRATNLH